MNSRALADVRLVRAIETAREFGLTVSVGSVLARNYSISDAADFLGCDRRWIMDHLAEFPRAFRLAGKGEWRISLGDLEAAIDRWVKLSSSAPSPAPSANGKGDRH